MGWAGHEVQWGHDPGSRLADVQTIYSTRDVKAAVRLLDHYKVRYVFVGSLERQDYGSPTLAKFKRLGVPVYRSGDTVVYRLSPELEAAAVASADSTREIFTPGVLEAGGQQRPPP